jgi:hypothetical protein
VKYADAQIPFVPFDLKKDNLRMANGKTIDNRQIANFFAYQDTRGFQGRFLHWRGVDHRAGVVRQKWQKLLLSECLLLAHSEQ